MSDWQPIATAPKDGTVVLLANDAHPEMGVHAMAWKAEMGHWEGHQFTPGTHGARFWDRDATNQPTHWQPLPLDAAED